MDVCLFSVGAVVALIVAILLLKCFYGHAMCHSTARLNGKTTIITGANTGIGKETAKDFLKRGATVILACRDKKRGEQAADDLRKETGSENVYFRKLDLNSLKSVKEFANQFLQEFKDLNILVNNAGIMMCPFGLTEDGFEQQFGVNHLGHFALTNLLLPRLSKTASETGEARVVTVSSEANYTLGRMDLDDLLWKKVPYSTTAAYGQSKLANVLFTTELHHKVRDHNISAFSLHPGVVNTELIRHWPRLGIVLRIIYPIVSFYVKSPLQGAQTSIYCAVDEDVKKLSGEYFAECKLLTSRRHVLSRDSGLAKKLWEKSEELTGVKFRL